jgi:hypothetical protein
MSVAAVFRDQRPTMLDGRGVDEPIRRVARKDVGSAAAPRAGLIPTMRTGPASRSSQDRMVLSSSGRANERQRDTGRCLRRSGVVVRRLNTYTLVTT